METTQLDEEEKMLFGAVIGGTHLVWNRRRRWEIKGTEAGILAAA